MERRVGYIPLHKYNVRAPSRTVRSKLPSRTIAVFCRITPEEDKIFQEACDLLNLRKTEFARAAFVSFARAIVEDRDLYMKQQEEQEEVKNVTSGRQGIEPV